MQVVHRAKLDATRAVVLVEAVCPALFCTRGETRLLGRHEKARRNLSTSEDVARVHSGATATTSGSRQHSAASARPPSWRSKHAPASPAEKAQEATMHAGSEAEPLGTAHPDPRGPRAWENDTGQRIDRRSGPTRPARTLGQICSDFKWAVGRGNAEMALSKLDAYHDAGGEPMPWMFDSLINMHARLRHYEAALSVRERMRRAGLQPSMYIYNSLLNAVARGSMSGYNLGDDAVAAAEDLLSEIRTADLQLDDVSYNIILDLYAKAGRFDRTMQVFEEMKVMGYPPTVRSYNALLEACKRTNRPQYAEVLLKEIMPAANVSADTQAWNTLLGAYGRNGDIDGAYRVWQEMMMQGVKPDIYTEMEIAEAFSSSPVFASEIISQARRFQKLLDASFGPVAHGAGTSGRSQQGDAASSSGAEHIRNAAPSAPSQVLLAAFQIENWLAGLRLGHAQAPGYMSSWLVFGDIDNASFLDLHRMSQATARAAFLERVHYLLQQLQPAEVAAAHRSMRAAAIGLRGPDSARDGPRTAAADAVGRDVADADAPSSPSGRSSSASSHRSADASAKGAAAAANSRDFVVVVGRGKHAPGGASTAPGVERPALRLAMEELCDQLQLKYVEDPGNAGRLLIPHDQLVSLAARSARLNESTAMLQRMRTRMAALAMIGFVATAAMSLPLWASTMQVLMR